MHELGLMQTALEAALTEAQAHGATRISKISLRVGEASGADSEVLRMGFAAMIHNTLAAGAVLAIEPVPVQCFCPTCQIEFFPTRADDLYFECPTCHRFDAHVRQGREICVGSVEVT